MTMHDEYSPATEAALEAYLRSMEIEVKIQISKDEHGQPAKTYYRKRVEGRQLSEMLGLAKGILADGIVSEAELVGLLNWLKAHPDLAFAFPGDVVSKRLLTAFADGRLDEEERADLHELLKQLVGEESEPDSMLDVPTKLAFDDPLPTIMFDNWEYVVTGRFAYGPRRLVEKAISDRGGRLAPNITSRTDVLVVGTFSSNAWLESTHGTKIESAYERRIAGHPIRIIPESHWYKVIQYDE